MNKASKCKYKAIFHRSFLRQLMVATRKVSLAKPLFVVDLFTGICSFMNIPFVFYFHYGSIYHSNRNFHNKLVAHASLVKKNSSDLKKLIKSITDNQTNFAFSPVIILQLGFYNLCSHVANSSTGDYLFEKDFTSTVYILLS